MNKLYECYQTGYDDGVAFPPRPPFPPTAFGTNSEYEAYMNGYLTGERTLSLRGNVVSSGRINEPYNFRLGTGLTAPPFRAILTS